MTLTFGFLFGLLLLWLCTDIELDAYFARKASVVSSLTDDEYASCVSESRDLLKLLLDRIHAREYKQPLLDLDKHILWLILRAQPGIPVLLLYDFDHRSIRLDPLCVSSKRLPQLALARVPSSSFALVAPFPMRHEQDMQTVLVFVRDTSV